MMAPANLNSRAINDDDFVRPRQRPERTSPHSEEVERTNQLEVRKQSLDRDVLLRDRKRGHSPLVSVKRVRRRRLQRCRRCR